MTTEERRIVTILFSDVVGSTSIAQQLDPEDWREIVSSVHRLAGKVVLGYRGHVLQYLGDGMLAIFGIQSASERDPERAIQSALELVSRARDLPTEPKIELRASVHTGLVVIGELGGEAKRELTASGDAMNLAARLQSSAEPNSVIISHETYRHVRGLFDIVKQDPLTLEGRQGVVQPYRVQGAKARPFRMVTRGVGGVKTTMVGRAQEMSELNQALPQVLQQDHFIWSQIIAEPGLGKTRMLGGMMETLDMLPEEFSLLRTQALEGDSRQPYSMIRRMWFDRFQITEDAPAPDVEARWEQELSELLGPDLLIDALALGLLIGLPFSQHPSINVLRERPESVKPRAFGISKRLFEEMRKNKPLVIFLEDLHWADRPSWDYLVQAILGGDEVGRDAKGMLVFGTARPEWEPPKELLINTGYRIMELQPLSDADSRQLVIELLQRSEPLPPEVLNLIVQRSEGIPYYAEEMINLFIDRGILDHHQNPWRFLPERLDDQLLPQTLHHLLSTRLNALSKVHQHILQAGSIFGSNFWLGGINALGIAATEADLEGLEQRGHIQARTTSSFANDQEWSFQHNLMNEVAYESVLKRQRPTYHQGAANWIEHRAREADRLTEFSGMLGHHYEKAGDIQAALRWYLLHDQVLSTLGEVDQRRETLDRLLELARESSETETIAEVQYRFVTFFESLGDYEEALERSEQALAAAEDSGNHRLAGLILAQMVVNHTRLGHHDAAAELAKRALKLLERVEDNASAARILTNVAMYYTESGDIGKAAELYQRQIEINQNDGERYGEAIGLMNLGYLYLQLGLFDDGRVSTKQAVKSFESLDARRMVAYSMLNLGLAYWRAGDPIAGKRCIEEHSGSDFAATQDRFGIGVSSYYLGLCLETGKELRAALDAYHDAREILTEIKVPGMAMDALAGLVRCELELGHAEEACTYSDELWAFLGKEGTEGMELPLLAFQACGRSFEACGEDKKAQVAWAMGFDELMSRADSISDESWRKSFLENVPEHRLSLEVRNRRAPKIALDKGDGTDGKTR